jgi:hypothetical protein
VIRPLSIVLSELLSLPLDERHKLPDTPAIYVLPAGEAVLPIDQHGKALMHGYL